MQKGNGVLLRASSVLEGGYERADLRATFIRQASLFNVMMAIEHETGSKKFQSS